MFRKYIQEEPKGKKKRKRAVSLIYHLEIPSTSILRVFFFFSSKHKWTQAELFKNRFMKYKLQWYLFFCLLNNILWTMLIFFFNIYFNDNKEFHIS